MVHRVPLCDQRASVVKWYPVAFDIEDRKQAEKDLRQSKAYLAEAQLLSHTGSFSWNALSGELLWSEESCFRTCSCWIAGHIPRPRVRCPAGVHSCKKGFELRHDLANEIGELLDRFHEWLPLDNPRFSERYIKSES
jgi:hypothetical protein